MTQAILANQNNVSALTDEDLVKSALDNQNAFAELINRYQIPLRRYIHRLAKLDDTDIDDILQESFIKLYLNLNDFNAELKFSSWLYRIVHNETMNYFRKRSVKYEISLEIEHEEKWRQFWKDDGITQLDQSLSAKKIHQVLNKLSPHYREVLILRYFEEKDYDEISDILQKPPGTIASWLNRAKTQFHSLYEIYE